MEDYSRTNTFTKDGRILQVEGAVKNVANAGTIIGVVCTDGIILLGMKKGIPSIFREKLYPISDSVHCAVSGIFSDCLRIIDYARLKAHEVSSEFSIEAPVQCVAKKIGYLKQSLTQVGGRRPFGVSVIFAGIKNEEFTIYSTDPSGTLNEWKAIAFGENEELINKGLKNHFSSFKPTLTQATCKLFEIISELKELTEKEIDLIEVLHYKEKEKKYLTKNQILETINLVEKVKQEK